MDTKTLKRLLSLLGLSTLIFLVETAKAQDVVETLTLYDLTSASLIQTASGDVEFINGLNQSSDNGPLGVDQADSTPAGAIQQLTVAQQNEVVAEPSVTNILLLVLAALCVRGNELRPRPQPRNATGNGIH
jgi:hypothetical protein